jgi:mycofactocin precursor
MEPQQQVHDDIELVTETLVEEVSIDGMCGVY